MRKLGTKTIVGLDIEPGYVTAVEGMDGVVAVGRAATAPLPPGVVREGEVADIDALASVLKELFTREKLGRRVRLGVANQRIVMRTMDLPPIHDAKQLDAAVRFQAADHIPLSLDQAVLEYHSLGIVATDDGPRTRVVVVAARRDMIDRLLEAVRRAGLSPQAIDLSAFAMVRALHRPGGTGATLYVSIAGVTNLAVAEGTTCLFTRVLARGAESMAEELAERRGLNLEHAVGWLRHTGLLAPLDDIEDSGKPEIVAEARAILLDASQRIADDMRNTLSFYEMQAGSPPVERIVLSGAAAAIPGFSDRLGAALGLPWEQVTVREGRPGAFGGVEPARLTIAAGLSVEEVIA